MSLPFTQEQFFAVFGAYNLAVWPAQIVLVVLAIVVMIASLRGRRRGSQIATVLLGVFWLWMGVVYHGHYFAAINPAALAFGVLFAAEGLILWWVAIRHRNLELGWQHSIRSWVGAVLVAYSLLVYPLLNHVSGHPYPSTPTFGLPCPTTIFTLGIFHWSKRPVPWACAAIPLIWSVIGSSAAFLLDGLPDLGLLGAGLSFAVFRYRAR